MFIPKPNGTVWLCPAPARYNHALITSVHKDSSIIYVLQKLSHTKHLTLIDAATGNIASNYTKILSFGRYRYARLIIGQAPAGDMCQGKRDKIFKDILNIFGIACDILKVEFDNNGCNYDAMLR